MHMSYWLGTSVGDLLFSGFTITSTPGLVMTCFGLVSLAILFEAIKVYQAYAKQKVVLEDELCHSTRCTTERSALLPDDMKSGLPHSNKLLILLHESGWYVVQSVLSYILMLCVMTYNAYFTISVCLGAGIGYLLFGPVLLEIGLKNGGIRRPKRVCPTCAASKPGEDTEREERTLADVGEGLLHCNVPPLPQSDSFMEESDNRHTESHCHESVAMVHRADV